MNKKTKKKKGKRWEKERVSGWKRTFYGFGTGGTALDTVLGRVE